MIAFHVATSTTRLSNVAAIFHRHVVVDCCTKFALSNDNSCYRTAAPVQIISERPSYLPLPLSQFTTRWPPFSMAVRRRFSRCPILWQSDRRMYCGGRADGLSRPHTAITAPSVTSGLRHRLSTCRLGRCWKTVAFAILGDSKNSPSRRLLCPERNVQFCDLYYAEEGKYRDSGGVRAWT